MPAAQIARLGVEVSDFTDAERRARAVPDGGVTVRKVERAGRAFEAGLQTGDVIIAYDHQVVASLQQFAELLSEVHRDTPAPLLVLRGQGRYLALALPGSVAGAPSGHPISSRSTGTLHTDGGIRKGQFAAQAFR
jgi:S1-C subfamily serine protease